MSLRDFNLVDMRDVEYRCKRFIQFVVVFFVTLIIVAEIGSMTFVYLIDHYGPEAHHVAVQAR